VSSAVLRQYYANISRFDDAVGDLLALLDRLGLRENTLIVYVSDNGWQAVPNRGLADGPRGKGSLYDPGFRTPMLMSWPARIPAGLHFDALVSTADVFATLLDYAGAAVPPGREGHSLRPLIEGKVDSVRSEFASYMPVLRPETPTGQHLPPTSGRLRGAFLRSGRWRYLLFADGSDELYDLDLDPDETTDLSKDRPRLARQMRRRLEAWGARMSETPPADRRSENPRPVASVPPSGG
jgi:arylsulfatase/arylsulfatase A